LITILTSDSYRHKFLIKTLLKHFKIDKVICEEKGDVYYKEQRKSKLVEKHFQNLAKYEKEFFYDDYSNLNITYIKKGIASIYYILTYLVEEQKVLNVHKIHYIRTILDDKDFYNQVISQVKEVNFPKNINQFYRYDILEVEKLKYLLKIILTENQKEKIISKIFNNLIDEREFSKNLYMNK